MPRSLERAGRRERFRRRHAQSGLRALSEWGRWCQAAPLLLPHAARPVPAGLSLRFAVDAGSPHDGGQEDEASQSVHDLLARRQRLRVQGEIAAPIVFAGTSRFTLAGELVLVVRRLRSQSPSKKVMCDVNGCRSSDEQLDNRHRGHCGAGFDQCLDVLRETAVAAEPGEGPLDDP